MKIAVISASVRMGRNSQRVALYLSNYIKEDKRGTVDTIDLAESNFAMFNERLRFLQNLPENVLEFADKIVKANGVIVTTPGYNGGYPSSLKKAIDLLCPEWKRNPAGISTLSAGALVEHRWHHCLLFYL